MPQSLASVKIHIVFSTKLRYPFLTEPDIRSEMHAYIGGICNNHGCSVIAVGGVADHVHILCCLSRTISIADLLQEVKASSSKWIKTKGGMLTKFAWQNGYGVFSVDRFGVQRVKQYILNQDAHHRRRSFQEEFRRSLVDHGVEFDERYVWD